MDDAFVTAYGEVEGPDRIDYSFIDGVDNNNETTCEGFIEEGVAYRNDKVLSIPGGLFSGFFVECQIVPGPTRFELIFKTEEQGGDFPFYFNGRFDEGQVVVRNSYTNGQWREEERDAPSFPFAVDQLCTVHIIVTEKGFRVLVDGVHFIDFAHRVEDLSSIKFFSIAADVTKADILFSG